MWSLAASWPMDEGSGLVVADSSGHLNHGLLTGGPAWTNGKCGAALQFDGTNDYVNCGSGYHLKPAKDFTMALWVKPDAAQKTYADILGGHQNSQGYVIQQNGNNLNQYYFAYYSSIDRSPQGSGLTTQLKANEWNFLVVQKQGTKLRHYLNGLLAGETTVAGDIYYTPGESVYIGDGFFPGAGRNFKGAIDEVAIFDRVLTSQEIRDMWDPSARWSMDEGNGSLAADSSGQFSHGLLMNGPTWTDGKLGSGLNFDGVNDYVQCGNGYHLKPAKDLTISLWVKPDATQKSYADILGGNYWDRLGGYQFNQGYVIEQNGNNANQYYFVYKSALDGSWQGSGLRTQLKANEWNYFVVQKEGTKLRHYLNGVLAGETAVSGDVYYTPEGNICIGDGYYPGLGRNFKGVVDEVSIQARAKTAQEILNDHKYAGMAAYWRLDEKSGSTTAFDSTPNQNNGTLMNMVPANCWVAGSEKGALQLDGVDDYVNCGNGSALKLDGSSFTITLWTKFDDISRTRGLIGKTGGYGINQSLHLVLLNSTTLRFGFYNNDLDASVPFVAGRWYHLAFTYDAVSQDRRIYVNGSLAARGTANGSLRDTDGASLEIGRIYTRNGENLKGAIDEVKIYNRALTESQIGQDLYYSSYFEVSRSCAWPDRLGSLNTANGCLYREYSALHVAGGGWCGSSWGQGDEYLYDVSLEKGILNAQLRMEYSDDVAGNSIEIYVDGASKGVFRSQDTGWWSSFAWAGPYSIGSLAPGLHTVKLKVVAAGGYGVNLRTLKIATQ
ncbi:MAG: LamG domain-containing protein [bacterium]